MGQRGLLGGGDLERHLKEEKEQTLGEGISSSGGTARAKALVWVCTWNVPGKAKRPGAWRWAKEGEVAEMMSERSAGGRSGRE